MKEDHVNIVIHGHEPVLSEMIIAVAQKQELIDYAKSKGANGIQLSGICCTANEMLQRHGVPLCGTFLQQELAIITAKHCKCCKLFSYQNNHYPSYCQNGAGYYYPY